MMQFKTKAPKITKRCIISELSIILKDWSSEGIEHTNAIMFKNVINVV